MLYGRAAGHNCGSLTENGVSLTAHSVIGAGIGPATDSFRRSDNAMARADRR